MSESIGTFRREWVLVGVLSTFAKETSAPYFGKQAQLGQDQFNAVEVNARQSRTMQEVLDEFNQGHEHVMALSKQVRPETLRQAGTIPWYGVEYALDDFIVYTSYGHKREHSAQIAAFRDLLEGKIAPPVDAMTASTVQAAQQFEDALNRRNLDELTALMTEDTVFENTAPPPDGQRFEGQNAVRAFWEAMFQASPQVDFQTEHPFALANRCIVRWRYHWCNSTGENGHIRGIDLLAVRDGKVAEDYSYVKG